MPLQTLEWPMYKLLVEVRNDWRTASFQEAGSGTKRWLVIAVSLLAVAP